MTTDLFCTENETSITGVKGHTRQVTVNQDRALEVGDAPGKERPAQHLAELLGGVVFLRHQHDLDIKAVVVDVEHLVEEVDQLRCGKCPADHHVRELGRVLVPRVPRRLQWERRPAEEREMRRLLRTAVSGKPASQAKVMRAGHTDEKINNRVKTKQEPGSNSAFKTDGGEGGRDTAKEKETFMRIMDATRDDWTGMRMIVSAMTPIVTILPTMVSGTTSP